MACPAFVKLPDNLPANEPRCSGDQDFHLSTGSLASSSRTSLTSGAMVLPAELEFAAGGGEQFRQGP